MTGPGWRATGRHGIGASICSRHFGRTHSRGGVNLFLEE